MAAVEAKEESAPLRSPGGSGKKQSAKPSRATLAAMGKLTEKDDPTKSPFAGCFKMAVYFPKFVMINNTRLTLMYYFLTVTLVVYIFWYFVIGSSSFLISKPIQMMVHVCNDRGTMCSSRNTLAEMELMKKEWDAATASDLCNNFDQYTYKTPEGETMHPRGCHKMCGSQTRENGYESCFLPADRYSLSPNMIFIPTYTTETTYIKDSSAACPAGWTSGGKGWCNKTEGKFVPAAEDLKISFFHEFISSPEEANMLIGQKEKKGSSLSGVSNGFGAGLRTVWYDQNNGTNLREYAQSFISPTVKELLHSADYEDRGRLGVLHLDQNYFTGTSGEDVVRPNLMTGGGYKSGASLRMTGVTLTVNLQIVDGGECAAAFPNDVEIAKDQKYSKYKVGHNGAVACMTVHAERMWTHEGSHYQPGMEGDGYREVKTAGIRIKFRTSGEVRMLEMTAVSQALTVAIVWIQVPLLVVYYFTVLCLGHLSSVYARVCSEILNLSDATKGLATRLISHSAAYLDLQDQPDGITKGRLKGQFENILQSKLDSGVISSDELSKYVDYVFEGMQSMGDGEVVINETVNIEEYCEACCTNEPLGFQALVQLFDKDRKLQFLENLFLDDTIRGVLQEAQKFIKEERRTSIRDEGTSPQATLVGAVAQVQGLTFQVEEQRSMLSDLLSSTLDHLGRDTDIAERAYSIGMERRAVGKTVIDPTVDFIPTQDPKPDQRESACSVADEEDPGTVQAPQVMDEV
jgi:hypothetical protein